MSSSLQKGEGTAKNTRVPGNVPPSRRRLVPLLVLLCAAAVALPISRKLLLSRPPVPPASAKLQVKMKYWSDRIQKDPSDVQAYVELGKLDVLAGYYTDATRRFYTARALGAQDRDFILSLGRALIFLGHFDEAKAETGKAVTLMPDSVRAICQLADVYDAENDRAGASRALTSYVEKHPGIHNDSSPAGKATLIQFLYYFLSEADTDRALQIADDLIREAPERPEGYAVSGQILVARKQYPEAIKRLEKALSIAQDEAAIHYSYGMALIAVGREPEAMVQWQKCLAMDPNMMNAYSRLAECYDRRHDYNHTVIALQKVALYNLSDAGAAAATAFAYGKLGKAPAQAYWNSVAAAAREDYQSQLKYALEAQKDPEWRRRGKAAEAAAYRGMNRLKEYVAAMKEVTSAGTAEDDVNMAAAYGAADMPNDQIMMLKRALTKKPKSPASIYKLLSDVADKQGMRDDAESYISEAIKLKPNAVSYHLTLAEMYMERRNEGGRLDKAIQEYKTAMKLDRYEVIVYQRIGIAYAAKGDLRRAAVNLEHALDLLPGDGSSFQELGRVYAKLGDKKNSEKMLELYHKYVDYDLKKKTLATQTRAQAKDPAAQQAMGDFLQQSGNYSEALEYYRQALNLQPSNASLKAKVKEMENKLGQSPV